MKIPKLSILFSEIVYTNKTVDVNDTSVLHLTINRLVLLFYEIKINIKPFSNETEHLNWFFANRNDILKVVTNRNCARVRSGPFRALIIILLRLINHVESNFES